MRMTRRMMLRWRMKTVKLHQLSNQMRALASQRPILGGHPDHESEEDLPGEDRTVEVGQKN